MFEVELTRQFEARQGLASPEWKAAGRTPITAFTVTIRVGFVFSDDQLDDDERFVDTDTLEQLLDDQANHLASREWTALFDRRPTFEFVTRWLYQQLAPHIPQLMYVSLDNATIGVATSYYADQ